MRKWVQRICTDFYFLCNKPCCIQDLRFSWRLLIVCSLTTVLCVITVLCILEIANLIPDVFIGFFSWPDPSSGTMALGPTQPLTEMSTRNLPRGKGWPVHNADNLAAICELTVKKMQEPRSFTTLQASMAHQRNSFTFLLYMWTIIWVCGMYICM
jgi:hypothetical protein